MAILAGCGSYIWDNPDNLSDVGPKDRTFQFHSKTDYVKARVTLSDQIARSPSHLIGVIAIRQANCSVAREVNFLAIVRPHRRYQGSVLFNDVSFNIPANTPINLQVENKLRYGRLPFDGGQLVRVRAYSLELKPDQYYEFRIDNRLNSTKRVYGCDLEVFAVEYSGSTETKTRRTHIIERVDLNPADLPRC